MNQQNSALTFGSSATAEEDMSNSTAPVILCVDGEQAALWVRALILSIAGYRVLTATTGEDALRVLRVNPVDLVIIDLWQPKSTGTEVADQMKRIHPKVPVILLSGLPDLPRDSNGLTCFSPNALLRRNFSLRSVVLSPRAVRPALRVSDDQG